jgi:hypothetical protein
MTAWITPVCINCGQPVSANEAELRSYKQGIEDAVKMVESSEEHYSLLAEDRVYNVSAETHAAQAALAKYLAAAIRKLEPKP